MKPRRPKRPPVPAEWRANLARIRARAGEEPGPLPKHPISLRIDVDVLVWFRRQGRGYQTRMNAILREYMRNRLTSCARPAPETTLGERHTVT